MFSSGQGCSHIDSIQANSCILCGNRSHRYQPCCEKEVCDFFLDSVLPADVCALWSAAAKLRCCSNGSALSLAQVSSHLHRHPALSAELCTTDLIECLWHLLPRVHGEAAVSTLHILMTLNATQSVVVELKKLPGVCRYLWGLVEKTHSDDNVREAAAAFLLDCFAK